LEILTRDIRFAVSFNYISKGFILNIAHYIYGDIVVVDLATLISKVLLCGKPSALE